MIKDYLNKTSCPYDLYSDPTHTIYKTLRLGRTLDRGAKSPEYMEGKSLASVAWTGFTQVLKNPSKTFKAGDWQQVGGEFLFVKQGEKWENTWAHKMRNTQDHAEVKEIKEVLGMGT